MRYKGLKGKFWTVFSEYTRRRDFKKYKRCVACGRTVTTWRDLQAGHYAPASNCGFALLFDERNVHGECAGCNAFDSGHLIGYRRNLVERYGEAWVVRLEADYNAARYKGKTTKVWNTKEYEAKIKHYEQELARLESE